MQPNLRKCGRYNIRVRALALGLSQKELLAEANKRTGRRMHSSDFSNAVSGKDRTAGAEQTVEEVNRILKEYEHPAE